LNKPFRFSISELLGYGHLDPFPAAMKNLLWASLSATTANNGDTVYVSLEGYYTGECTYTIAANAGAASMRKPP
jgi:hypothetical protein